MELVKKIDIHYNTENHKNSNYIKEWYSVLKKYDKEDVYKSFEHHLKSDFSNITPKLYYLVKDLKTPEQKVELENLHTICPYCKERVSMNEFDKHYSRCLDIDFIEKNVKKYCDQQIIRDDYYNMSDSDLKLRFDKIARIAIEKSENELERKYLKKYFNFS